MNPQTVYLNAALEDVINKVLYDNPDRKVAWNKQKLPCVNGDPAMLQQVLTSLVSNAIKFTRGRDMAEIEIGYSETPAEVMMFVRDNGVGFDMQYADKLFGIFQRLHRPEEYEGVGLGLASARRIIARHGGRTWAEAKPNTGATFYFSLPKRNA
jgi:light-regulated signal transduction histidine kinase (bacteriophytochrome)